MAMFIKQVKLAQSRLAMVRNDLNGLKETHKSVIQRIVKLEGTLLRVEKNKFQLKKDVKMRSLELAGY